jgi:hypothetical protein
MRIDSNHNKYLIRIFPILRALILGEILFTVSSTVTLFTVRRWWEINAFPRNSAWIDVILRTKIDDWVGGWHL